jgi:A/G-specific adenine glycosylase
VWVSEIMLQQTQVVTVVDYFPRFLQAFPTIADLAAADEQQVLRVWEGLGYYRRARQLHQAAKIIVAEHAGRFPREPEVLRSLPGIGRYTAGAIASIAWDAAEPILEANTLRLLSRLLAYREDVTRTAARRLLWSFSARLLPKKRVGHFNQALMELGSEICTPRGPCCDRCPARPLCPTAEMGWQDEIPLPAKGTRYEDRWEAAVVVRRRDTVLLRRCGPHERWAGLWDFPRFPLTSCDGQATRKELADKTRQLTGMNVKLGRRLTTIKHGVTRFRITLVCHEATWIRGRIQGDEAAWVRPRQLEEYPLSVTGRRISRMLTARGAGTRK